MKVYAILILMVLLTACSTQELIAFAYWPIEPPNRTRQVEKTEASVFKKYRSLLAEGWKLTEYEGKLVFYKETNEGVKYIYIYDK